MGPNLEQLAAQVAELRTQLSRLTVPENGRPPNLRLARVTGEPDPDIDGIETAEEPSDGVRWKVRFVDVLFPVDGDEDIDGPTLVERSSTDQLAAATRGAPIAIGSLVGCAMTADGTWWIVSVLPTAEQEQEGTCCGCSPTDCTYDGPLVSSVYGDVPPVLTFDAGDLLCCDGRAGGVQRLNWTGTAWQSPSFWCTPDAGGGGSCGTALYTSVTTGNCTNDGANAYYLCTAQVANGATSMVWQLQQGCPSCYENPDSQSCNPDDCDSIFDNGKQCVLPCIYTGDQTDFAWQLTTNNCTCDEQPTPPADPPTSVDETATVDCPGTPDETPAPEDPPCTDGQLDGGVLENAAELADLQFYGVPGTVTWVRVYECHSDYYTVLNNGCDPNSDAKNAEILVEPYELDDGNGVYDYIVTTCPSGAECPPSGTVVAFWRMSGTSGYAQSRLELVVGGVVKIRYNLPSGRIFCAKCHNRMIVEQDDCDWPCANIPERVCVRPVGRTANAVECGDYATAYSFTVPTLTINSPTSWECLDTDDIRAADGAWVLDLVSNTGEDPRYEENGCRTNESKCCTWLAPAAFIGANVQPFTTSGFCFTNCECGWVLQTCQPRTEWGSNRRAFQTYECDNAGVPLLSFGIRKVLTSVDGPAAVRWMFFQGGSWGYQNASVTGCDCCSPGNGDATPSFDCTENNSNVQAIALRLEWRFDGQLTDGTLVMVNDDFDDTPGDFPRTILLTPA